MKKSIHIFATAAFAAVTLFGAGCAVVRQQETVGAYVDDTTITTQIKARMASAAFGFRQDSVRAHSSRGYRSRRQWCEARSQRHRCTQLSLRIFRAYAPKRSRKKPTLGSVFLFMAGRP